MDLGAIILALSPGIIAISAFTTLLCNVLGPWARRKLSRPECRLIVLDRVGLSQYLGNPKIWLSIHVQNNGHPSVLIRRLICTISDHDGSYRIDLPSYYMGERDIPYLFRPIPLKHDEHWSGGVIFFRARSDSDA